MHISLPSLRRVLALWPLVGLAVGSGSAQGQWTIDYTVRYEAAGQASGKPGEQRGPDTLVSEQTKWRLQQEVRGTLNYAQKVRGAVASNMPDKNNEQRYDSWLSRSGRTGNAAALRLDAEEIIERAARLGQADGEGAGEINRQRAGKFGRTEHTRMRAAMAADGATAARLGDGFVQIDRVDGKLHFEPPAIEFDETQVRYAVEKVTRIDKPAAAGEWDSTSADGAQRTQTLRLPRLPVQVFDMARDADHFEGTRTLEVPGRFAGKATLTVALRRTGLEPAGDRRVAVQAAPSTANNPSPSACRTSSEAPSGAADVGAEAGGKVIGGGFGRQVGSAVGGLLGALGKATQRTDSPSPACPGDPASRP